MARTKKPKVVDQRQPEKPPVDVIPVKGDRELVTIGPDSPAWEPAGVWGVPPGSIVRIQPPAHATPEDVELVRKACAAEASAVRVMPVRRSAVVVKPRERVPSRKWGDHVRALVDASNYEDREALRTFCEAVIQKVGTR